MRHRKRTWTPQEKWLWATPLIFVIGAGAAWFGPAIARRGLVWPRHRAARVGATVGFGTPSGR